MSRKILIEKASNTTKVTIWETEAPTNKEIKSYANGADLDYEPSRETLTVSAKDGDSIVNNLIVIFSQLDNVYGTTDMEGFVNYLIDNDFFRSASGGSGAGVIPSSKTGTSIVFTESALYNEAAYLESGDLTLDLTGAVKGSTVLVYCDSYIPVISGENYFITSGILFDDRLNILSFLYDGNQLLLNIASVEKLSAPVITLTSGDTEIEIDWSIILGANNYVIERSNDNFVSDVNEIYNGSLFTYTDTGLINGTTYYYRAKTVGNGYIESNWSSILNDTPIAIISNLLANWDASVDASVTTANGAVTQWNDQTANANNLSEATNTPTHNIANDTISFAGVDTTSCDVLSKDIAAFDFQQSDDFTILVKGLKFDSSGITSQHVLNNKLSNALAKGWSLNLAGNGLNLYFSHTDDSLTQNYSAYPLSWKDDVERDLIVSNESGVLKFYDATNTNVGTNGTTSISAITYGITKFKIGVQEESIFNQPFEGSLKVVKVWDKALSIAERNTELGL